MTSSTKPEVRNVMKYSQSRTEPRSQVTDRKFVEIWTCSFYRATVCQRTADEWEMTEEYRRNWGDTLRLGSKDMP